MFYSSIKIKITCAVFSLVLLSMSAASLIVNLKNENVLKKTIVSEQEVLVDAVANQIDGRISDALVDLYDTADAIRPEMLAAPRKAQQFLDSIKEQQVFYDDTLFLLSRSGKLLAASPAELNLIGRDYSFREYFQQTIKTEKILVSPPIDSIQKKTQLLIMFTAPVYGEQGEVIGVLGGAVNIQKQRYLQSLRLMKLGRGGYLSLYDIDGTILMHPQSRLLRTPATPNSLINPASKGRQATREITAEDGTKVIRSVRKLQSTDWVLAVSYPVQEAYAPLYAARKSLLLSGILAALLSALSAWHLIKMLLAPLTCFTGHLERFKQDGAPVPVPVPIWSDDEFGVMARAFNGMIGETKRHADELRELKDFAENLVLNSSLPTFVLDLQHTVLYWNKACERLTGTAAAAVAGTSGHRIAVYGQERPSVADRILNREFAKIRKEHTVCISSEVTDGWHCEGWFEHSGGRRRYLVIDAAPIFNHEGNLIAAIETIQDKTQMEEAANKIEQLSRVIEQCPYTVVLAGLDGTIEYANPRIAETIGLPAEQVVGEKLFSLKLYGPDADSGNTMREAIAHGAAWQGEIVRRRKDGKLSWDHVSLSHITNRNGAATHLVSIFNDITTRKEAEQALRESEARHRQMFENNPQPMWVYDLKTLAFLAVNNAAVYHYGYSREEFLSMTIKEIRPSGDVQPLLASLARHGDRFRDPDVWRHVKKDGTIMFVRISWHPMLHEGRAAEMVLAHDVTETKLMEYELRLSEERYRNIFDGVADIIYSVGIDSRFVSLNRAFEEITGWPRADWLGRSFTDLIHPEDLPLVHAVYQSCLEGNHDRKLECRIRTCSERVVYLEIDATPQVEDGQVVYVQGIARNVTERMQLEEQLRQSQKMEALGTLTGGIAHDFNNILTAITAYCSLLERLTPAGDAKARRYLGKLMDSTERASALTRNLLAYSRKQPFNKQVTDLNRVVASIERLLSPLIGEDIEFITRRSQEPVTVLADSHQIEQVLMNLTGNARDAMPGGGKLRIEVDRVSACGDGRGVPSFIPAGNYARLTVSDTGTGMDNQTRERIFDPFYTTKEVNKGTGLGLSIVYGIVQQHDGFIDVSSEPSKGSVFSMYFPVTGQGEEQAVFAESHPDRRGHGTILLVEDDQEIRASLKELLEESGYRIVEACDGEDGIQKYREHQHDVRLVILDVMMPRKNGKMACDEIRSINPAVKVLFISGYTSDILSAKGISDDDVNFMSKPIGIQPLLLKIEAVLHHGK